MLFRWHVAPSTVRVRPRTWPGFSALNPSSQPRPSQSFGLSFYPAQIAASLPSTLRRGLYHVTRHGVVATASSHVSWIVAFVSHTPMLVHSANLTISSRVCHGVVDPFIDPFIDPSTHKYQWQCPNQRVGSVHSLTLSGYNLKSDHDVGRLRS
jgi:hypothetical protein